MTAPVDVLDVLAANVAVANTARQNDRYTSIVTCADCMMEAREALAAIAELIEAATEVDRLSRGIGDWSDEKNVERAVLRQRAALARIGGGK